MSANISPDPAHRNRALERAGFSRRIHQYRDYAEQGSPVVGPESFTVMPWLNFCQLPEEDLRAIY